MLEIEIERETSLEHFKYFKNRCKHWMYAFGMLDWEWTCGHKDIESGDAFSWVYYNVDGRTAMFYLAKTWEEGCVLNKAVIDRCALHEVLEVMLSDISTMVKRRFIQEKELDIEVHRLIRRFENKLLGDGV